MIQKINGYLLCGLLWIPKEPAFLFSIIATVQCCSYLEHHAWNNDCHHVGLWGIFQVGCFCRLALSTKAGFTKPWTSCKPTRDVHHQRFFSSQTEVCVFGEIFVVFSADCFPVFKLGTRGSHPPSPQAGLKNLCPRQPIDSAASELLVVPFVHEMVRLFESTAFASVFHERQCIYLCHPPTVLSPQLLIPTLTNNENLI